MKVTNPVVSTVGASEAAADLPAPGGPSPAPAGPARTAVPDDSLVKTIFEVLPHIVAGGFGAAAAAKAAGSVKPGGPDPKKELMVNSLSAQAEKAGLSRPEAQQLATLLKNSPDFKTDSKLVQDLLNTKNADRALQTLIDLDPIRKANPGRVTPDMVRTLTMGVGQQRTTTSQGAEGILGHQQAVIAAKTMADMPQSEYDSIKGALDHVGGGKKGADPQTEKALILKAAAARHDALVNFPQLTKFLNSVGLGNPATSTITDFADTIRGVDPKKLIHTTSAIDLDVNGKDEALEQRFSHSCGPATLQIARSEADPVYAWKLHNDTIHDTNGTCPLATEQKNTLNNNGGNAVPRNANGTGMWIDKQLNDEVSPASGHPYTNNNVGGTNAARTTAVDAIEKAVRKGQDVPIVVAWSGGGSHYQIITDVRGTGNDRKFLVTDPWNGRTDWVKRQDIINGNTNFFAGQGNLQNYYD